MSFVVDGAQWRFDNWSEDQIIEAINKLLERVWTAHERQEKVWIGDDLQNRNMLGDLDLWSMCFTNSLVTLPKDLVQELTAWLAQAPFYVEEEWPAGFDDTLLVEIVPNAPAENADVAWVHHQVRSGRPMACLGLTNSGFHNTKSSAGDTFVHWVNDEVTHRKFWRSAIDIEGDNERTLERMAAHAFPDLYFHDGVWKGLKLLAGGYQAIRLQIRKYLTVLDDHGKWVFTAPPSSLSPCDPCESEENASPTNQIIEKRFKTLTLDMAPENPNVHANKKCREAREIKICNKILYCEWHGKLEPHRNRLHIHAPVVESGRKLVIAIFHEHLPLPQS